MQESPLLDHIIKTAGLGPGVIVGPGDDAAIVRTPSGDRLVLTVDQLIEGRHFTASTPIDLVARKAIARSISDLAAMAARPAWALATGALPAAYPQSRAAELFDRMHHWARQFGCPLVGGDIAALSSGTPVLTVTAIGLLDATSHSPLRSGARAGDAVYVTGALGGSFDSSTGLGGHLTFEPRVREARALEASLGADLHAMMDISDGLGRDAGRIARASGVRLILESGAIPLSPGITAVERALRDGEDYELLFTVPAEMRVPPHCPATGTPITRIGRVEAGDVGAFVLREGAARRVDDDGWDHGASAGDGQ